MTYHQIIQLKNGASCCLRSGTAPSSASASLRNSGALALARHSPPPASTAPARLATPSWSALALYKKFGFVEYGRNPKGFRSRNTGYQELVLMRLAL